MLILVASSSNPMKGCVSTLADIEWKAVDTFLIFSWGYLWASTWHSVTPIWVRDDNAGSRVQAGNKEIGERSIYQN